jgi:hypothetical protein
MKIEIVQHYVDGFSPHVLYRDFKGHPGEFPSSNAKVKMKVRLGFYGTEDIGSSHRSHLLSRRASRPGSAGEAGRRSACKVIGFSSKQINGCWGS